MPRIQYSLVDPKRPGRVYLVTPKNMAIISILQRKGFVVVKRKLVSDEEKVPLMTTENAG